METPITMSNISHQKRNESSGTLTIKDIFLNQVGTLHLTLEDVDHNLFDTDLDNTAPTITLFKNRTGTPPPPVYYKDGPARIPKIGDTIKAFGKFTQVTKLSVASTKKQIYKTAESNEEG